MKKPTLIITIIIGLLLLGALIFWNVRKDSIIKESIQSSISDKSDSLYKIRYDSSVIDEIAGNARFYNVVLGSDSLQERISRGDSSENIMYSIRIGEVAVTGANVAGLLTGSNLQARSVEFLRPDIYLTRLGDKTKQALTKEDSIALYRRILGNLRNMQAGEIVVKEGRLRIADKNDPPHTSIENINLLIRDFRIDSTNDYENIISYFIKGTVADIGKVVFKEENKEQLTFSDIHYDAAKQMLNIGSFSQANREGRIVSQLKNINISGLATNAFINDQNLIADKLSTDGGSITLYKTDERSKQTMIELDSSFFDRASLNSITAGKTRVSVYDRSNPSAAPVVVNNVTFSATDIPPITSGKLPKNIIANSKWVLAGDGLSYDTDDKVYRVSMGAFYFNTGESRITVKNFSLVPKLSEHAFVKSLKEQKDLFDIRLSNIVITGAEIKTLVSDKTITAENMSFSPVIKIFNDRTVPRSLKSKVPTDPVNLLQSLDYKVDIKTLKLNDGYVSYREKGMLSGQTGQVFFSNLNAVLTNVTNMPSSAKDLVFDARAKFMGVGDFSTKWLLSLDAPKGDFRLGGKLGPMQGHVLNAALEPQAMLSVRKGNITSFNFSSTGNENTVKTTGTLLYKDIKLDILEKDNDKNDLDKRNATSFLANILIKDNNPQGGDIRTNTVEYNRDPSRSFFYLITQSFFIAARKTLTGKGK